MERWSDVEGTTTVTTMAGKRGRDGREEGTGWRGRGVGERNRRSVVCMYGGTAVKEVVKHGRPTEAWSWLLSFSLLGLTGRGICDGGKPTQARTLKSSTRRVISRAKSIQCVVYSRSSVPADPWLVDPDPVHCFYDSGPATCSSLNPATKCPSCVNPLGPLRLPNLRVGVFYGNLGTQTRPTNFASDCEQVGIVSSSVGIYEIQDKLIDLLEDDLSTPRWMTCRYCVRCNGDSFSGFQQIFLYPKLKTWSSWFDPVLATTAVLVVIGDMWAHAVVQSSILEHQRRELVALKVESNNGRKPVDAFRPLGDESLVEWCLSHPLFLEGYGSPYNENLNDTARIDYLMGYIGSTFNAIRLEKLGALSWFKVVHDHQVWRLVTSIWLHDSNTHLLGNMLMLLYIGIGIK
ncbi:hypothetical protein Sjap_002031 [Stephania japonica]|uniref:RHOMBOID-like protein n=1 Tax=Stephania japonica TaxID=461633 RepID=A0AAP0KL19_9MAGN